MTVQEVCTVVETMAPKDLAYGWDRVGLSLGNPEAVVGRLLVTLTVTREAFRAAKRRRADMIVSHHPLIRDPLKTLRSDDPGVRLCLDIAQAGIACYAAHTNLDVAPEGMNRVLAEKLGLLNTAPLIPAPQGRQVKLVTFVPESHLAALRSAVCEAGAGVIGRYTYCTFSAPGKGTFLPAENAQPFSGEKGRINEENELRFEVILLEARLDRVLAAMKAAHPYEEAAYDIIPLANRDPSVGLGVRGELPEAVSLETFAETVRRTLGVPHVRVVGEAGKRVRLVGVLGGGGGEVAGIPRDIDVYVTGDVRYHDAVAARERGVALVDPGHAGMEKWIVPMLEGYLKKACKSVRVSTYWEPEVFRCITE